MPSKLNVEIGSKFGEWTVVRKTTEKVYNRTGLYCVCSCGKEQLVSQADLMRGGTKSCKSCRGNKMWEERYKENPTEKLFWSKVVKRGEDKCWEWQAGKFKRGYGAFSVKGKLVKAHRYSYELHYGEFDQSKLVLHSCDNPSCVNPKHLFLGNNLDNMKDMVGKGRALKGEDHHSSKLTEEIVKEMRRLHYDEGVPQNELAIRYGVKPKAANYAIVGKTWKHID